jgi:hypothetical protein
MNTNKNREKTKKVIVVLPDGSPYFPEDHVPPEIAEEIRYRHANPTKYISLNELLSPKDDDIIRRKKKQQETLFKKRIEREQKKKMIREVREKIEKHNESIIKEVKSVINLDDDSVLD